MKNSRSWVNARFVSTLGGLLLLAVAGYAFQQTAGAEETKNRAPESVREQAARYISYYHSIHLTQEQEDTKARALQAIPAPCCNSYSIATCCCPCNLAKSVWGLSNYLIAKKGYDAEKVKNEVKQWLARINENGFSGVACFKGQCGRSFDQDGCGGMNEEHIS